MEENQSTKHRSRPNYLGVFVVLTVLTAIEVGVTYLPLPRVPILIPLALIKASLVALFYMHLKFDKRSFAVIFGMGLLIGIGLILAMIALFAPALSDNH
jgi:caa(3)-type oxidase subunit IV